MPAQTNEVEVRTGAKSPGVRSTKPPMRPRRREPRRPTCAKPSAGPAIAAARSRPSWRS